MGGGGGGAFGLGEAAQLRCWYYYSTQENAMKLKWPGLGRSAISEAASGFKAATLATRVTVEAAEEEAAEGEGAGGAMVLSGRGVNAGEGGGYGSLPGSSSSYPSAPSSHSLAGAGVAAGAVGGMMSNLLSHAYAGRRCLALGDLRLIAGQDRRAEAGCAEGLRSVVVIPAMEGEEEIAGLFEFMSVDSEEMDAELASLVESLMRLFREFVRRLSAEHDLVQSAKATGLDSEFRDGVILSRLVYFLAMPRYRRDASVDTMVMAQRR